MKSRWLGPLKLIKVYPHEAVELLDERTGQEFKVNGHRVKDYIRASVNHPNEGLFLRDPTWASKDNHTELPKIKC